MQNRFTANDLVRLRRVASVAPSPDGSWLAVGVERLDEEKGSKYVGDIWRVPLDGGDPVQLTHGKWNDRAPAFRHDGSLVFLSNRPTSSDDEAKRSQVFVFPTTGGDPVALTDEPLGVAEFRVAREADVLVVKSSTMPGVPLAEQRERSKDRGEHGPTALVYDEMPVRFWDHWLPNESMHLVAYLGDDRRDLTPDYDRELFRGEWDLAADGAFVIVAPTRLGSDRLQDQWLDAIDVESGTIRRVASGDRTWFSAPCISPDGRSVAAIRTIREDGRFTPGELCIVDTDTGEARAVAEDLDTALWPRAWAADGSEIVCVANWQTHTAIFSVDVESGSTRRISSVESGGTHHSVSVTAGERPILVGSRSTRLHPPEPYTCALETGSTPTIVAELSGFQGGEWVVDDCTVKSTDGVAVQYAVLHNPASEAPRPVLNWIHGGPISDWGDVWHWRWNSLVAADLGYAVVLPNPRGSTGFGTEFINGIWNNSWGGQCYEDLVAVFDAVEARDDTDADRTVAMGGSFGGYMTNWIGTQTDRFSCLVTHASLFDLAAFHGVTDSPAWWAFSFGVDPYAGRDEFARYSPLAHVSGWKSPVLIIHGDKDYRVPVGESLALFEALRFHGVDAKLLVYPDENHWILRPKNVEHWYETVFDFMESHLTAQIGEN